MSENLSETSKTGMPTYNGKYDPSKSFTPNLKLDSKAAKIESIDLTVPKVPQPGDPDFIGPLPQNYNKLNDPISGPFTPPDSDKPIELFDDDGTLIDSYAKDDINFTDKTSIDKYISKQGDINGDGKVDIQDLTALQNGLVEKGEISDGIGDINGDGKITVKDTTVLQMYLAGKEVQVDGVNEKVAYNETDPISFSGLDVHTIPVERGNPFDMNNTCDTLSGCCETEDYYIISYKSGDDSKQRIKLYNKKTWEVEKEFTTRSLDHTNGLTTDGKYVYITNCAGDKHTVTKFSLDDPALNSNKEPNLETDYFDIATTDTKEQITGISFDYTNKNVCVAAQGDNLYISKPDGTVIHAEKVKVPDGYADTTQDICVANDKIYVIRTKDPANHGQSSINEGCNMIDIYDTNGKYIESKKLDLPENSDSNGDHMTTYRELESVSYDAATDSFTLYYTTQDYGYNKIFGNAFSNPHAVVTGVKFD